MQDGTVGETGDASLVVRLDRPSTRQVTVTVATGGGTATGGVDYVRTRGRLTFAPGTQTATFEVAVTSDGDAAIVEQFFVDLTDPVGGDLADAQGTVTLRDCVTICEA